MARWRSISAPAQGGRADLRPAGRANRAGARGRHDRRDAAARPSERAEAGVENVEFVKGHLEELPLPDASVDVVISNCVINLSGDKSRVLAEAARVLRPSGRFAVSDVIADEDMDDATRADMAAWTGCIAGALTEPEFRAALAAAGLADLEFRETHPRSRSWPRVRVLRKWVRAVVDARWKTPAEGLRPGLLTGGLTVNGLGGVELARGGYLIAAARFIAGR